MDSLYCLLRSLLPQRAMSWSMALLHLGSVMVSMAHITTESHVDTRGLSHRPKACWSQKVTLPLWPYQSAWPPLLSRAVMMSGPELQSRAMAVSCPWSCWNWGMCWWLWFMLPLRAKGKLAPVVWAPEKWSCSSQATSWESGLPSRKNWPQRHGLPLDFPATATRELAQPLAIGPGEVDWIAWMWESCLWHLLKRDQWTWWRSGLTKSATTETHIQGSFPVSSPTFSVIYM